MAGTRRGSDQGEDLGKKRQRTRKREEPSKGRNQMNIGGERGKAANKERKQTMRRTRHQGRKAAALVNFILAKQS